MTEKGTSFQWKFAIKSSQRQLRNVCLLSDNGVQNQFKIDAVDETEFDFDNELLTKETYATKSYVDWVHPDPGVQADQKINKNTFLYDVSITFEANIYGTFRQTVIFAFGCEPYLRRDLSVDVKPVEKDAILDDDNADESEEKLQELHDLIIQVNFFQKSNSL